MVVRWVPHPTLVADDSEVDPSPTLVADSSEVWIGQSTQCKVTDNANHILLHRSFIFAYHGNKIRDPLFSIFRMWDKISLTMWYYNAFDTLHMG